jgi:hypothetical protein
MEWLSENWVLVLVFGGMAAMHVFGHARAKKHKAKPKPVAISRVRPRSHPVKRHGPESRLTRPSSPAASSK